MTTLITGATGFLGGWLTRLLARDPKQTKSIRVLVRSASDTRGLRDLPVEIVEGDLLDGPSLRRALSGVQQVYHAAGWITFRPADADSVHQVNYHGTVNLFDAALESGVERVVYPGSIFAVGYSEDGNPVDLDHTFNGESYLNIPYVRAKRDADLAARDFIARGLPLIRLYPGICLGPGDVNLSSSGAVAAWIGRRLPAIVAGGGIPIIDVRDAASALIVAMQNGEVGPCYFAPGYNLTGEALFAHLATITNRRPPLAISPRISVPLMSLVERLGIMFPVEVAQARLMAARWWYADSSDALGFKYRPLDETLRDTIEWVNALADREKSSDLGKSSLG